MYLYLPVHLLLSLFSGIVSECDIGGTWSTWLLSPYQTGYDFCGSSWQANWIRKCLSASECPCNGPTEFVGEMNTGVCIYPRTGCFPGYSKTSYNSAVTCVNNVTGSIAIPPINETRLPNDTYCPPSGVGIWGSWSKWGSCTASCGQFGAMKRTRACISEAYGCPCFASDIGPCQTAPCPWTPCPGEPKCRGPLVLSNDGQFKYCYPFEATPLIGSWTEWAPVINTQCNGTCGMFGQVFIQRFCLPPVGSVCNGSYTAWRSCPENVCTDGRPSCNVGYEPAALESGGKVCVLKKP